MEVRVCRLDELPRDAITAREVDSRLLALARRGDQVFAFFNACPHKGGPLCDGIVAGDTVVCPLHAYKVSLTSGRVERPSGIAACVRTYETRVENGIVMLRLDAEVSAA